jgi:hypothetical protein
MTSFSGRATSIERLRERLRRSFSTVLGEAPLCGVLVALAIGDQQAIPGRAVARFFRQTGVTHLMSISGLHVTMVAALFAALVGWLWRRSERLMLLAAGSESGDRCRLAGRFRLRPARRLCRTDAAHALHVERWWRWRCGRGAISAPAAASCWPCCWCWCSIPGRFWRRVSGSPLPPSACSSSSARRASGAAWLACDTGPLGDDAVGGDGRYAAFAVASLSAVFAGLAAGQCPGHPAGQLPDHAAGAAVRASFPGRRCCPSTTGCCRADGFPRMAGGLAGLGTAGTAAGWRRCWRCSASSGCCCRAASRHAGSVCACCCRRCSGGPNGRQRARPGSTCSMSARGWRSSYAPREHSLLYDTGPLYSAESDAGQRIVVPYLRAHRRRSESTRWS